MNNLNYGGSDYVRIHAELLTSVLDQLLTHINPSLTVIRDRYNPLQYSRNIFLIFLTLRHLKPTLY